MTSQTNAVAWPEGVLYRYATIVGATVDVIACTEGGYEAVCRGCDAPYTPSPVASAEGMQKWVQPWAQEHSTTCRALPRPTA
ncbi:hypothetical protein [Streptomyces sp. NPDC048639]|uniref:hypothetical protein n=1 Tax=Streptomyces sp. NPDC048639 TaxID=3365581 RepID=UPI0037122F85